MSDVFMQGWSEGASMWGRCVQAIALLAVALDRAEARLRKVTGDE